jgi:hypothetical protein
MATQSPTPNTPLTPAPVLDLSTLVERPIITIDKKPYELRHPDELSIIERMRVAKLSDRVLALTNAIIAAPEDGDGLGISEAEEVELVTKADQVCRALLLAPDDIHARLRDEHRIAIAQAFSMLQFAVIALRRAAAKPATGGQSKKGGQARRARPIGTRTSRGSSGSTAATQSRG